ncbi:unnamed protein product [Rotaria sordida]|uniref:Uncharacterized protein n=1 Tax=Rotaria sordida TaxID=392033 RepID=A0A813XZF7_9BILA|nr:unnamed protein product [Rotaria sordida]CAF0784177.1 unnamed protein product [Rotaria sordida]CAF0815615.1 unnamed protein product [Rotaria sordida]CAF0843013.1 unnamed protein product [Rotaria sordida]CAF0878752.1 unnamed protein product [Rotaria sordida]
MSSLLKSTHIDRDDFDADHYADFIRDSHRSRITLDQLDIARRQHRKKEKLLSRIHYLKMKEHIRVKNDFIRKIEQDIRISNLPSVKETLKAQRRQYLTPSPPPISNDQSQELTMPTKHDRKSHQLDNHPKSSKQPDSPRTERSKANLNKFNHMDLLLG